MTRRTRQRAFTLVELLVVVAIIVVLLAILTPALGNAYSAAIQAKCLTQQHAIGLAMNQYAMDNKTYLPPQSYALVEWLTVSTRNAMHDYLGRAGEAFYCPSLPYAGALTNETFGTHFPEQPAKWYWENQVNGSGDPAASGHHMIGYLYVANFDSDVYVVDVNGKGNGKEDDYVVKLTDMHKALTPILTDKMKQAPRARWQFRHSPDNSPKGQMNVLMGDGSAFARKHHQVENRYLDETSFPQTCVGW